MITIDQFDGQYSSGDIAKMNARVAEILAAHGVADADLSDGERVQITQTVENEVAGNYDPNIGGAVGVEMPAAWARLLASRA